MKSKVAQATRLLAKERLIELHGHVSCREKEKQGVYILGHIHNGEKLPKNVMEEDIVEINIDGEKIKGKWEAPEEYPIHTEIYRANPYVNAVVHAHPRHCVALSAVGKTLLPIWNKGRFFAPEVPFWRNSEHIDSSTKGIELISRMGSSCAIVLQGHGTVTIGRTIEEAVVLSLILEETAIMQLMIANMGEIETIKNFGKNASSFEKGFLKPEYAEAMWQYYLEK